MSGIDCRVRWEGELSVSEHEALARVLSRVFPDRPTVFTGGRSWFSGRPEVRAVGSLAGRPVAQLSVLRRFLRRVDGQCTRLLGRRGSGTVFDGSAMGLP